MLSSQKSLTQAKGKNHITTIQTAIQLAQHRKARFSIYDALSAEVRRTRSKKQAVRNLLSFLNAKGHIKLEKSAGVETILREAEAKAKTSGHSYTRAWRRFRMYKHSRMKIETVLACEIYLGLKKLSRGQITPELERGILKNALASVLKYVQLK